MKLNFLFVFIPLLLLSCKKKSINCDVECGEQTEELLFQTGFNGTEFSEESDYSTVTMTGNDPDLDSISDWSNFESHSNIGLVQINFEDGGTSQRSAEIVDDPLNPGNDVMKFQIWEPHIKEGSNKKGRVNTLMRGNNCLKEIYEEIDLYFHPDLEHAESWDEAINWLTIFEFWNNGGLHNEKKRFRVTVNLKKEKGSGNPLYFNVKGDHYKNLKWKLLWEETGTAYEIEYGKWMHIEWYLKEGDDNNGRFWMSVQPEGAPNIQLFDLTNTTQHPKEKCPDGYTDLNPHKWYTSDKLINYFKDNNKNLAIYWDNWRFYKNKTPN